MDTIFFSVIGIIVGGITSFWVGKYYFKKGVKEKSLTPFLQFASGILTDIDEEVRNKLKVRYDKKEVTDLYQLQFVIANTGDVPIRDCIKPLSLTIPEKGEVLDVNILYIEPVGRDVSYEVKRVENVGDCVFFSFPLLNASEYFIAKMLIKGKLPTPPRNETKNEEKTSSELDRHYDISGQYKFLITVDDLPPIIETQRLPFQYEIEGALPSPEWSLIIVGLVFIIASSCFAFLLYSFNSIYPALYIFSKAFWSNFSFLSFATILGWIIAVFLIVVGFAMAGSEMTDLRPKRKPKFKIPRKLSRRNYPFIDFHS